MSHEAAIAVALWSGGITFGAVAAGMLLLAAISNLRGRATKPVGPFAALFGAAVIAGIPVAIAWFVGLVVSVALIGMQTPPIAYLFVGAASCLAFAVSLGRSSYGMNGCSKMFAVMWSAYAVVWSAVSFWLLGGVREIGPAADSLTWLCPPLVALPYAALLTRVTDKKRRSWGKFLGALTFLSALFALIFLPVEGGVAAGWLPDSDWLRFPLAAAVVALLLAIVPVLFVRRASPTVRKRRRRELPRQMGLLSLIFLPAGFLWAAARALTAALA